MFFESCMKITLDRIGKRFNRERIFAGLSHVFEAGNHTAILGSNGSGKSTLLQIIAGSSSASEGSIRYEQDGKMIDPALLFRQLSFASPYMEVLEELSFAELAVFHASMKPLRAGITAASLPELAGLSHAADKQIRYYSSGMKQRVRLTLAILSDSPLLLLDEPCSNLDAKAITWYQELVNAHASDRLILVCSNQLEYEYSFCSSELRMERFKS
jgi:ABC-type multidrug transport system ATPase subunit